MGHWRPRRTHQAKVGEMVTQPIGVDQVPDGSTGFNGVIRFTVVERDVPTLSPVRVMRTL